MRGMVLREICNIREKENPLQMLELPEPSLGEKEILIRVSACGVCHTELDEIEGRLKVQKFPIVPGHQVVGRVESLGERAFKFKKGDRVGVAWIYSSCGNCFHCKEGYENLCNDFKATGCDADGGYAEFMVISEDFVYPIPARFSDVEASPLLCAGVIGYRALRLTGIKDCQRIGLYGFGASAHIVIQIVKYKYPNSKVFVFTREGQIEHQNLAKKLGADWVGKTSDTPAEKLHCAIDFTPSGLVVSESLRNLEKGGRVVINAIRKETPIPPLDYTQHLWYEKEIKSVANVTRKDAEEFLPLAAQIPIIPKIQEFSLEDANKALFLLKEGKIQGGAVLKIL